MAGETNTRDRVVPTCHAVAPLVGIADSHGPGWSRSAGSYILPKLKCCAWLFMFVCVLSLFVNYVHTYQSVANEPLNLRPCCMQFNKLQAAGLFLTLDGITTHIDPFTSSKSTIKLTAPLVTTNPNDILL